MQTRCLRAISWRLSTVSVRVSVKWPPTTGSLLQPGLGISTEMVSLSKSVNRSAEIALSLPACSVTLWSAPINETSHTRPRLAHLRLAARRKEDSRREDVRGSSRVARDPNEFVGSPDADVFEQTVDIGKL